MAGWVVVVGSINMDLTVHVATLPRPGETVVNGVLTRSGGGKSANQACAAARFGADTHFLGAVGDDPMADEALATVAGEGIDISRCVRLPGVPTAVALIMVDVGGENQIAVASGASGALDGPTVMRALDGLEPPPGSVLLLSFEVSDDVVLAAARWAFGRGMRIVVDPGPARPLVPDLLALHPILKPNQTEATQLTGELTAQAAAAALRQRTGAPVIVTLGAGGALLLDPDPGAGSTGIPDHVPSPLVETVDATGAGDALTGILAACIAAGAPLRAALAWAVTGAALSTLGPGARGALPTQPEVAQLMGMVTG
jgi:ribokinase